MTLKPNTDNGLQERTTEHQLPTAVLQKWRCSASYDSEVVNQNLVLRLKFSGENRHLRKAAERCVQFYRKTVKKYEPYFVESISEADEENKYYIFDVIPPTSKTDGFYDENFYYELHIKTADSPIYYNDFIQDYIHIEIIDFETMEIYEGEFYEESMSNGSIKYESLNLKKIEKKLKNEWKPKLIELRKEFNILLNKKILDYLSMRTKVIVNYQNIYINSLSNIDSFDLTNEDITKPYLFNSLYHLFVSNPAEDSLNKLIDPNYYNIRQSKSWKDDYDNLYLKYENLKNIDISDYKTILNHIIEIYERTYEYMLPSLLINFKNIDKDKYERYFKSLMTKLRETS